MRGFFMKLNLPRTFRFFEKSQDLLSSSSCAVQGNGRTLFREKFSKRAVRADRPISEKLNEIFRQSGLRRRGWDAKKHDVHANITIAKATVTRFELNPFRTEGAWGEVQSSRGGNFPPPP